MIGQIIVKAIRSWLDKSKIAYLAYFIVQGYSEPMGAPAQGYTRCSAIGLLIDQLMETYSSVTITSIE